MSAAPTRPASRLAARPPLDALSLIALAALLALLPRAAWAEAWSSEVVRLAPRRDGQSPPVVVAVALEPQGRRLAIAGDDHVIRIWHLGQRRVVARLTGHTDWVRTLSFAPDGDTLASAGNDHRILLWRGESQAAAEFVRLQHAVTTVLFSPDGSVLAAVGFGGKLRLFDVDTGAQIRELNCPCVDMRALDFAPDNSLLAGGGRNGILRFWNSLTGSMISEHAAHRQRVRDLEFSPDGRYLASCGEDRRLRIAGPQGGDEFILPVPGAKVMSLAFVGPEQLATGGSDNLIRIWDLERRVELDRLPGHTGSVMSLDYRGDVLVSAGYDTTVRIWRRDHSVAEESRPGENRVGRSGWFEIE